MPKQQIILVAVVAVIVGLVGGYFWGSATVTASYAQKIAQVNKMFPAVTYVSSLSGQAEGTSATTLTLKTVPVAGNPFAATPPAVREVIVTSSTTITRTEQKDPVEYQKEVQAYTKQMASITPSAHSATTSVMVSVPSPMPFTTTNIALSDIKAGDTVLVMANSNIASSTSFVAMTIQDQGQAQTAVAPSSPTPTVPTFPATTSKP